MKSLHRLTLTLFIRLLRIGVVLLFLAVVAIALVLLNPHWLVGTLKNELALQGIKADIPHLYATFSGTTYQLRGDFQANTPYGIDIQQAHLNATVDWYALWKGEPFITHTTLANAKIAIDRRKIQTYLKQHTGGDSTTNTARYLPLNWQIHQSELTVEQHRLSINASGKQDQEIEATLTDNHNGQISAVYHKQQHHLLIDSQQLDLSAFSDYPAILRHTKAQFNTQNWLDSQLTTQLDYQGISSHVSLHKEQDALAIRILSDDKQINAKVIPKADKTTVSFNQLDLSIYEIIRPLIPLNLHISQLKGQASGQFTLRNNHLHHADIVFKKVTIKHPSIQSNQLDADIHYDNNQVDFQLQFNHSSLLLPTLFDQDSNHIDGRVSGNFLLDSKMLTLQSARLSGDDFEQLEMRGTIYPDKQQSGIQLNLSGILENADLSKTPKYLPYQLPAKTRSWLGKALVSGKKNHTDFTLSGNPTQYKNGKFDLLINTRFQDSVFHYLSNNPNIHFQSGEFGMNGRHLWVTTQHASIGALPISDARTDIKNILKTTVDISATMHQQDAKKMLAIATNSIAGKIIQRVKKVVNTKGKFDLELGISLTLYNKQAPNTFTINLHSKNAQATLLRYPALPVSEASTDVVINQNGLQSIHAKGQLQGKPASIHLLSDKKGFHIDVNANGNIIETLEKLQLLDTKTAQTLTQHKLLNGRSTFDTQLSLTPEGKLVDVTVRSTLVGTQLNLFSALKKARNQQQPLSLIYQADKQHLNLKLGQWKLETELNQQGSIKGILLNNQAKKQRYQSGKNQVYLTLEQLDYPKLSAIKEEIGKTSSSKIRASQFNIRVEQLKLPNQKSYPLTLSGNLSSLAIDSPIMTGKLDFQGQRLHADIQRLMIDDFLALGKKTAINPVGREVKTISLGQALPPLTVLVDDVYLKGKRIGTLNLKTSEEQERYSIDQLLLSGDNYYAELSGYEADEPQGVTTHIQADFKGEKLRNVTQLLGLNDAIDGKSLDVSMSLSWPGKAHTLNLQQSYGKGQLAAQNLKMLNIDAGVGSLFGLIDIASILKRITLDFQNLTTSKIAFDTVEGSWNIGGGRAVTRDFFADGSIIALKLSGPIDLYRREFDDLKMTVMPRASNVLPIIGAVTGGVVGGAIGFVVQQVLGDQIDSITGLPYVISGTWDNPKLTFGDELTTSKNDKITQKPSSNENSEAVTTTSTPKDKEVPPLSEWFPESNTIILESIGDD